MNLKTWLDAERGRRAALAARLQVTPGRVTQIADGAIPAKFMIEIRDFTGGVVTLESMVQERTPCSAMSTDATQPKRPRRAQAQEAARA